MLWSLLKILIFVAGVTALTFGAVLLMDVSGQAQITLAGIEVTLSPLELVVGLLLLVVLVWISLKLLGLLVAVFRFLNGDETAVSRYFTRNRERRGYEALSEGMMALASGEGHLALAKAAKAEKYLERPELTNLLTAQAAELAGDRKKAEQTYRRLLESDKTRFVGVRGIMKQKLTDGDTDTAMKLAEHAFALKPKHEETQDVLLKLQANKGDWKGARKTLGAKLRYGSVPRDLHKRRDAVLALSEAKAVLDEGSPIEAREAALEANRLSPDLVPAACMAARTYIGDGNAKYATRILKKAWAAQPHPDIAAVFADIAPTESAEERVKRFGTLTKGTETHAETKMLFAELQIAAENFPDARRALGDLTETEPNARVLTLLAAIEKGSGASEAVVRSLLSSALSAPRAHQWVCENCNSIHSDWAPICANCSAFDTLTWKQPASETGSVGGGRDLLPLFADSEIAEQEPPRPDVEILLPEPEK